MSYLIDRYKGKYRLLCDYDLVTNQYPRTLKGTFEDSDIYIACQKNIRVYHYGHGILHVIIPSVNMGMNIIRQIYATYINKSNSIIETKERTIGNKLANVTSYKIKDDSVFLEDIKRTDNIIYNIEVTDAEVLFKFHAKNDEIILPLLKPKTEAANRSPFSSKNLPKTKYDIPENDLTMYKEIISKIPQEKLMRTILDVTNGYLKSLTNKKTKIEDIKSDMAIKG